MLSATISPLGAKVSRLAAPAALARSLALSASDSAVSLNGTVTLRPLTAPPRKPRANASKPSAGGANGT